MLKDKRSQFGTVSLALAILTLQPLLLWAHLITPGIGILSFAVLCLLLSCLISFQKRSAQEKPAVSVTQNEIRVLERATPETAASQKKRGTIINAFSIDLEDYFHTEVATRAVSYSEWDAMPSRIRSSVSRLLDVLDEGNTRSTVFVLGWVARKYPSLVRQVHERGHEIACHSDRHRPVFRLERESFREDTQIAKAAIEDACGVRVSGYRAPSFSITPGTEWAFDVLEDLGFLYDSSINPVKHPFYNNAKSPRTPYYIAESSLLEIPIATWRVGGVNLPVGGGAYLRLLPYQYVRTGLTCINRWENEPFTLYVHPWEIDRYQPLLKLDWKSNIRQTWGVQTMESRIARLLGSFNFAPIQEVYSGLIARETGDRMSEIYEQFTEHLARVAS